jgi:hypothetical protein
MTAVNDLCPYCGAEVFPGEPCGTCKESKVRLHGARTLLGMLTVRFPPPQGKSHALLLRTDGEEGMLMILHVGEKSGQFLLDSGDMDKPIRTLVSELTLVIDKNPELKS